MSTLEKDTKISVIGLGYVGLPVAYHMSKKFKTKGFDIKESRIKELQQSNDSTNEVSTEELQSSAIQFTNEIQDLQDCNFHIIAVPTPIDKNKSPDLAALTSASSLVAKVLKPGDIVTYESTVYPGATEEVCLPILLKESGLKRDQFNIAYSPERINPGDREHSFDKIKKVVSADTPEALNKVSEVYRSVVSAGVFEADSIKIAEAAKVIENTQRDVNIALMNELCLIFDKMDINIHSVLEAANTKWNFLNFKPGLVGGHCVGVDPYYLTFKAKELGHHPEVILSGRKTNDDMGQYIAQKLIKHLIQSGVPIKGQQINIYGLTFKENCPDLRNTKVIDVVDELKAYGAKVSVTDSCASSEEALKELNIELVESKKLQPAVASIVAVKHKEYVEKNPEDFDSPVIFDVKGIFNSYNGSKTVLTM